MNIGVEPAPCSALAIMNTIRYFCIDDDCPSDEHSTVPFFAAQTFSKSFKSEKKNHFMNVDFITVYWSILKQQHINGTNEPHRKFTGSVLC